MYGFKTSLSPELKLPISEKAHLFLSADISRLVHVAHWKTSCFQTILIWFLDSVSVALSLFASFSLCTFPPTYLSLSSLPYSHPLSFQTLIRGRKATQNAEHEEKEVCILPAFYLETKMYITKITTSVILASTYQTELLFP